MGVPFVERDQSRERRRGRAGYSDYRQFTDWRSDRGNDGRPVGLKGKAVQATPKLAGVHNFQFAPRI